MKDIKRITLRRGLTAAFVFMFTAVLAASAGCIPRGGNVGSGAININPDKDASLQLSVAVGADPHETKIIQELAAGFKKEYPKITFKISPMAGDTYSSMNSAYKAKNMPDIFMSDSFDMLRLGMATAIEGLDEYIKAETENGTFDVGDYDDYFWKLGQQKFGGQQWMLPRAADQVVVHYNKLILSKAGVDLNTVTKVLFKVIREYRQAGWPAPRIVYYFANETHDLNNLRDVYNTFYSKSEWNDVWFKPDGKPWAIVRKQTADAISATSHANHNLYNFFELKYSCWPQTQPALRQDINGFPWIDFAFPQNIHQKAATSATQGVINVSVAQHPVNNRMSDAATARGRGWNCPGGENAYNNNDNGSNDAGRWKEDLNFQQQWNTVFANDDKIETVFITGWNEWIALKKKAASLVIETVDQYNEEFSRDAEPSRTGTKDNTYLLSAKLTREYKMTAAKHYKYPLMTPSMTNADDGQWALAARYADFAGDAAERNAPKYGGGDIFNATGRNDITGVAVAHSETHLYFKITCKDNITIREEGDARWMNIHINTRNEGAKDARGYQYVINRAVADGRTEIGRAKAEGGYEKAGEGDIFVSGKNMTVRVPLAAMNLSERNYEIDFKVSDNVQSNNDPLIFYTMGDCAPYGRLNYKYGY